jgi:mannose-6-phosphate isomerase
MMISDLQHPLLLDNRIQHYAWGAKGAGAFIPRLLGIHPEPDVPYAELWIGTHPKAPSTVVDGERRIPLPELLAADPDRILGPQVARAFAGQLPFLFKVLSADVPLSIQAHPNREQARELHARDPQNYPDDNHKPEIAIALDGLSLLAGFKPADELAALPAQYPELAGLLPAGTAPREICARLIAAMDDGSLAKSISALAARLGATAPAAVPILGTFPGGEGNKNEIETIFTSLAADYPNDIGMVLMLCLNHLRLAPGQAIFLGPGIPHAYLKGDIIECMSASDNVVRAGLTPKFIDTAALLEVLDFEARPFLIDAQPGDQAYETHAREFRVRRVELNAGENKRMNGGQLRVLLALEGAAHLRWPGGEMDLQKGQSVLLPACMEGIQLEASGQTQIYLAETAE